MIDSILTFCDEVLSNPVWFYVITPVSYTHLTLPTN